MYHLIPIKFFALRGYGDDQNLKIVEKKEIFRGTYKQCKKEYLEQYLTNSCTFIRSKLSCTIFETDKEFYLIDKEKDEYTLFGNEEECRILLIPVKESLYYHLPCSLIDLIDGQNYVFEKSKLKIDIKDGLEECTINCKKENMSINWKECKLQVFEDDDKIYIICGQGQKYIMKNMSHDDIDITIIHILIPYNTITKWKVVPQN